jgi:5'-methylthioinosine phosphorylase
MKRIALIGGTGAGLISPAAKAAAGAPSTPYGEASGPLQRWQDRDIEFSFLPRHGADSSIPPHRVNYRANLWALRNEAPDGVIGINAVGGIAATAAPSRLVLPDQIIDYTWGREQTFNDGDLRPLAHIELTEPFSLTLRERLLTAAARQALDYVPIGTYGATQGPRLETRAEIDRMERDGCHIVGMTGMPEAALARELGFEYAIIAVVVNWAAGRAPDGQGIHADIEQSIDAGMGQVRQLLAGL